MPTASLISLTRARTRKTRPDLRLGFAASAICLIALAGCTGVSPQDCASGDWEAVGFIDGTEGSASGEARRYRSCEAFDLVAWEQGRLKGLRGHCTELSIYRKARTGLSFPAVCQPYQAELSQAYAFGRQYWELDLEIWRLERRSRDEVFAGRWARRVSEYNALRRERALYSRWPPPAGFVITEPDAPASPP